jgi:regulator of PEP synthase PpsR (kinase-PPPase family)
LPKSYFHLHLLSDATGETLIAAGRAVAAQFQSMEAIEHVYPLIRNQAQLDRALNEITSAPGIVLYTLVEGDLATQLDKTCADLGTPCLSVLQPIVNLFQSYLGTSSTPRPGAQHMLDKEYFKRIDALNYTLIHDDGQLPDNLQEADVLLLGVSRTSKTPTSIYLANRGIRTANIPLVPGVPLPTILETLRQPLIVGLIASPERIVQIRQNRLLTLNADQETAYVDRMAVAQEIAQSRQLFQEKGWPFIDVTRRSIEETAAAILDLYKLHRSKGEGSVHH